MEDGPSRFTQGSTCPVLLGCPSGKTPIDFAYGAVTLYGRPSQTFQLSIRIRPAQMQLKPRMVPQPRMYNACTLTCIRFRLFPFRSPLLRESHLLSFPRGTKMVQFPPFATLRYVFTQGYSDITRSGFPHSDIFGSKLVWQLTEAYRSLPRPSSPPGA